MPPDDELQSWFSSLPYKVKRELAGTIREEADGLAAAIEDAAPKRTGRLAGTVKVRRKRNELDLEVTVGGEETSKEIREGSGMDYDYALAAEFGTSKQEAEPFVYPTYRARREGMQQRIEDAVADAIDKA